MNSSQRYFLLIFSVGICFAFASCNASGIKAEWSTIWSAVSAIATVAAAFAIYFARKQLNFDAWLKAQDVWIEKSFTEARGKIFQRLKAPKTPWTDQDRIEAKQLCRKMDEFAYLVPYLGKDKVLNIWADPLAKAWIVLDPIVQQERKDCEWPTKWSGFEKLGKAALQKLVCNGQDPRQNSSCNSSELSRAELLDQLSRATDLFCSEDQVLWSIFGAFWGANTVLLVALFATGTLPSNHLVGIVISSVGAFLSITWHVIQERAIGHLFRFEMLVDRLERKAGIPTEFATSRTINQGDYLVCLGRTKTSARTLMRACSVIAAALWIFASVYFVWLQAMK
jgi:hypothetical protein